MRFGGWEILILLVIALLIFGPSHLPHLGRALGRMVRWLGAVPAKMREPSAARPADETPDSRDRG